MSEPYIYPFQIIRAAMRVANIDGREVELASTSPIIRRADLNEFGVEFGALQPADKRSQFVKIFFEGQIVFHAEFDPGWQDDTDKKLDLLVNIVSQASWRNSFIRLIDKEST